MSKPIKDGGPAYPSSSYWDAREGSYSPVETDGGMSLRDWFAGQAMSSIMEVDAVSNANVPYAADIGLRAYQFADYMIEAREEKK